MNSQNDLPLTLPYHIAGRIQHGIVRGRYPLGSNLREQDLGAEYGSSRGPVRESLRLLELQGLVVHSPRRGFRVKQYTVTELEHLYRMRAQLESVVIDALRETDTEALAADLERINEGMRAAADRIDLDSYFDLNVQFHQLIIDHAASATLSRVLSTINDMSLPIRYALVSKDFPKSSDYRYHKRILNAVRARDFTLARQLTEGHVLENIPKVIALAADSPPAHQALSRP
jgi:DNA-binding GntR family transcriptional regulator